MDELRIREASIEDIPLLLNIYAPYVLETAISFEHTVPSEEEFRRRMETIQKKYLYLVIEKHGELLGYCYASSFHARAAYNWNAELSIYIAHNHRREHLGSLLYREMEDCLKAMGIANLYACIACPNKEDPYLSDDSIRFHEHCGFSLIGRFHNCGYKFHRWYDMVYMEKIIGEHNDVQSPIKHYVR